jgi:uncharacterized protein YndB with AHSA1/START domain
MQVTVETEIAAPPEVVFATMADVARWPDFIGDIERVELLAEGPVRVGTRFRETRQMFGRSASEEMTVAELDSPRRCVLTAENHGTRYVATHEVTPTPNGARLALTFAGTPVTLAARLFSVVGLLFMGSLRRKLETDLRAVKAEAERRAAAGGQGQPQT